MNTIDIIIPCYRYGRFLRQCVESVLSQGEDNIRVLIIDDASPDDTPMICEELSREDQRVSFIRHEANRGHIYTYNEGIDWIKADYMLLLSADDYLLPGSLLRAIAIMESQPAVGLVFGNVEELSADNRLSQITVDIGRTPNSLSSVMRGEEFIELCVKKGAVNIVPTPSAVVRTTLLKRLGGYVPELPHAGDLEMWLRLAAHSHVGIIHANQAVYRRHANNMSIAYQEGHNLGDLVQRRAAVDIFIQRCGPMLSNPELLHTRLLRILSYQAVEQASRALAAGEVDCLASLCSFAKSVHPDIRRTVPWIRLAVKRLLGMGAIRATRPDAA